MGFRQRAAAIFLAMASAGVGSFAPRAAHASVSIAVSWDGLLQESTSAAVVTPFEAHALWENGRIFTYTHVRVERALAGDLAPGTDAWVRTMGGIVGDIGQVVEGEAVLSPGRSALLFLHPLSSAGSTPALEVTARGQGQFPVVADADPARPPHVVRNSAAGLLMLPHTGPVRLAAELLHGLFVDDAARGGQLRVDTHARALALKVAVSEAEVEGAANDAAAAVRVAVDVEASGMHAYRARACIVQLAWDEGQAVAVVDALATSLAPLRTLLGADGPIKVIHDVAFDARLLAEAGIVLGRVHDTAIAARMLGRTATGLASLLESELGLGLSKAMQHHDWRIRPLDDTMIAYLVEDVRRLELLERKLWSEVAARGIEDAVLEETQYRIDGAVESAAEPIPPFEAAYFRVKGADRLGERQLSALRAIAEVREREAEARDVPPYKVAPAEALVALARTRPTTATDVARLRAFASPQPEMRSLVEKLARALATAGDHLPTDERAHFKPPPIPSAVFRSRREREARLLVWRRAEAKIRGVDEQVVLPGHCVRDVANGPVESTDDLRQIPGIGAFRVERDGEAIVRALHGDVPGIVEGVAGP